MAAGLAAALLGSLGCNSILGFEQGTSQTNTGAGGSIAGTGGSGGTGTVGGAGGVAGGGGTAGNGGTVDTTRPTVLWSHSFGGTESDAAYGVAFDGSSSGQELIVGGGFRLSADIAPGTTLVSQGGQDMLLSWFDADGGHRQSFTFGDQYGQYIRALSVDAEGQLQASGNNNGTLDFGGGGLPSGGGQDVAAARFVMPVLPTPALPHVASFAFGGTGSESMFEVASDSQGDLVHVGSFADETDFGGGTLQSAGGADGFVVRHNADGQYQWGHVLGPQTADDDFLHDVAIDSNGNAVVVGYFSGETTFAGELLLHRGSVDAMVAKLAPSGALLWAHAYGDTDVERAWTVCIDDSDHVIVIGDFFSTLDMGGASLQSSGGSDLFVAKLDPDGNHVWSRSYAGDHSQVPLAASLDHDGNIIVTGFTRGDIDFGGGVREHEGGDDVFVVKLSAAGEHLWSDVYGGNDEDRGRAAVADGSGNVYLVGSFKLGMTLGATPTLVSKGDRDGFIAKLAP